MPNWLFESAFLTINSMADFSSGVSVNPMTFSESAISLSFFMDLYGISTSTFNIALSYGLYLILPTRRKDF